MSAASREAAIHTGPLACTGRNERAGLCAALLASRETAIHTSPLAYTGRHERAGVRAALLAFTVRPREKCA